MNNLECCFLEVKTITSNSDGKEYSVMSVLYRDKFGYRVMDFFMPEGVKNPKFLQKMSLSGFWYKKEDEWRFRVVEVDNG